MKNGNRRFRRPGKEWTLMKKRIPFAFFWMVLPALVLSCGQQGGIIGGGDIGTIDFLECRVSGMNEIKRVILTADSTPDSTVFMATFDKRGTLLGYFPTSAQKGRLLGRDLKIFRYVEDTEEIALLHFAPDGLAALNSKVPGELPSMKLKECRRKD
jgi:hypothetical protein